MNKLWNKFINKIRIGLVYEEGGLEKLEILEQLELVKYGEEKYNEDVVICRLYLKYKENPYVIHRYRVNNYTDAWNVKINGVLFEGNVFTQIIGKNGEFVSKLVNDFIRILLENKK